MLQEQKDFQECKYSFATSGDAKKLTKQDSMMSDDIESNNPGQGRSPLTSIFTPGTLTSSTISMIGSILSAGCVTIPQAFSLVGVFPGFLMLIAGHQISLYTSKLLIKTSAANQSFSYEALAQYLNGVKFNNVVMLLMFILMLGYQVSQLVMTSTLCTQVARKVFGVKHDSKFGDEQSYKIQAAIIQFIIILPITLLKRIKDFLSATIIQQIILIYIVTSILICSITFKGEQIDFNNSPYQDQKGMDMDLFTRFSMLKLYSLNQADYLKALPFVIFAFAGQPWVLGVQEGLEHRNKTRAYKFLKRSITQVLFILCITGFFGQLLFLDTTQPNILLNDFQGQEYAQISAQLIIISNIFSMPQNTLPMRNVVVKLSSGIEIEDIHMVSTSTIVWTALLCNLLCFGLSVITSKVDYVMTVVGDTLNVFVCFMLPCVFYIIKKVYFNDEGMIGLKTFIPMVITFFCGISGALSLFLFIQGSIQITSGST